MKEIQGVITAMVTPFDEDGGIDLAETAKMARYLVENGSHGLVVAGTTGESPTLEDDEKIELLQVVLEEVGDTTTVILGSGSNDTRHSVELTKMATDAGADERSQVDLVQRSELADQRGDVAGAFTVGVFLTLASFLGFKGKITEKMKNIHYPPWMLKVLFPSKKKALERVFSAQTKELDRRAREEWLQFALEKPKLKQQIREYTERHIDRISFADIISLQETEEKYDL